MRLRLSLPLVLASALAALPALAQPDASNADPGKPKTDAAKGDSKPDDAKAAAKQAEARLAELVKRGAEACERGELEDGLATLSSAFAQKGDAEVAATLAACEVKAGRWASAADHYAAALRLKEEGPERKKMEEAYLDVRKRVGSVKVTVNVEGADVFVDSRFVGQSPLPGEAFVDAGKRATVTAKKTGFDEAAQPVEVPAQKSVALTLTLRPTTSTSNNPYARAERSRVPFYVLGGAAILAGAAGAALHAAAASKGSAASDLLDELKMAYGDTPCQPAKAGCATIRSLRSSHDHLANLGTGFLIGGGVLLGAAALTGVWTFTGTSSSTASVPGPRTARAPLTFAPVVSPDGAGLWLNGAF